MRRLLAALLICAVLFGLGGCKGKVLTLPGQQRVLTLCADPAVGQEALDAAEVFAEVVGSLSDGKLTVEITWVDAAQEDLALDAMLDSSYDLYLVTNTAAAKGLGDYLFFASPFYFKDYSHASMALNSDRLHTLISARTRAALRVEPMAAFYGGSRAFVQAADTAVLTLDEMMAGSFGLLQTPSGILENVLRPSKLYSMDELNADFQRRRIQYFDVYKKDIGTLDYPSGLTSAYLVDSFHMVDINWLMLGTRVTGEGTNLSVEPLTDWQMAVLREAAAHALAANDEAVLARESEAVAMFAECFDAYHIVRQISMREEFDQLIRGLTRYKSAWNWDTYDELRAIAT